MSSIEHCFVIIVVWMMWLIDGLKKRLLGDEEMNTRFADSGTADRAAAMEDNHFSLTLVFHSLYHWEPTMGTFLTLFVALLHYCILNGYNFRVSEGVTDSFTLSSVSPGSSGAV